MQLFQNISYLDLGEGEMGRLGRVAVGGAGMLIGVEIARWKAWPAVEMLIEILNYSGFVCGDSIS